MVDFRVILGLTKCHMVQQGLMIAALNRDNPILPQLAGEIPLKVTFSGYLRAHTKVNFSQERRAGGKTEVVEPEGY
jgi:hypothetical protein